MTSKEIREARNGIMEFLNKLDCPAEVKRLMLGDIVQDMERAAFEEINAQVRAANAKKEEMEKKGKSEGVKKSE